MKQTKQQIEEFLLQCGKYQPKVKKVSVIACSYNNIERVINMFGLDVAVDVVNQAMSPVGGIIKGTLKESMRQVRKRGLNEDPGNLSIQDVINDIKIFIEMYGESKHFVKKHKVIAHSYERISIIIQKFGFSVAYPAINDAMASVGGIKRGALSSSLHLLKKQKGYQTINEHKNVQIVAPVTTLMPQPTETKNPSFFVYGKDKLTDGAYIGILHFPVDTLYLTSCL